MFDNSEEHVETMFNLYCSTYFICLSFPSLYHRRDQYVFILVMEKLRTISCSMMNCVHWVDRQLFIGGIDLINLIDVERPIPLWVASFLR